VMVVASKYLYFDAYKPNQHNVKVSSPAPSDIHFIPPNAVVLVASCRVVLSVGFLEKRVDGWMVSSLLVSCIGFQIRPRVAILGFRMVEKRQFVVFVRPQ
jgi:hypothetical protein